MTYYLLQIEFRFRPEVVERILRVIRHRGFILCALNMFPRVVTNTSNNKLNICIIICSNRSIDVLCEHLNKLVDIVYVIVQDSNENYNCLDIDRYIF